jgi:SpoIID/LytB domain protein
MGAARRPAIRGAVGVLALAVSSVFAVGGASSAGGLTVAPTDSFALVMLGNGHGHGLSQYGARGAAIKGLTAPQIVAFYYPHTKLVRLDSPRRIRVRLSGGAKLTVAPAADLTVTGVSDPLPTTGVRRLRLVPGSGTGLWLQQLASAKGAKWVTLRTGLPDRAQFHRTGWGTIRRFLPDGTSTDYHGFLRAIRNTASGSSGGLTVVNRLTLDNYTAGVVPREMPASWQRAAVRAQAIAARTYGAYAMAHPQSRNYDICDTSWCQVYGGAAHQSGSTLLWSEYQPAATATSNQVLTYNGAAIFAQFSASNGGWTVAGGQPYLVAKQDPYDNADSGDPYLNYRKKLTVKSIAGYFGLAKITQIVVTKRDGNGTWDGRVLAGYVYGTDSSGNAKQVKASGYDFQAAFGIGTTWFTLRST